MAFSRTRRWRKKKTKKKSPVRWRDSRTRRRNLPLRARDGGGIPPLRARDGGIFILAVGVFTPPVVFILPVDLLAAAGRLHPPASSPRRSTSSPPASSSYRATKMVWYHFLAVVRDRAVSSWNTAVSRTTLSIPSPAGPSRTTLKK